MYVLLRHSVGPVLSGEVRLKHSICTVNLILVPSPQIYQRFGQGWTILNLVAVAVIIAASAVAALFTGERPLARRLRRAGPVRTCKWTGTS